MTIAVLVNLRARRGSPAIARMVRAALPEARLAVTSSLEEARHWVHTELAPSPPSLLLSGGGDGTAVGLLTELRAQGISFPAVGMLALGTGNALARVTGAPRTRSALRDIARLDGSAPPLRDFALVQTEGRLTPFAGVGWDAEVLSDYRQHVGALPAALRRLGSGFPGYLASLFTRSIPRQLFGGPPATVTVTNLGEPALAIDPAGRLVPVPGGGAGAVLHRGPLGVAGAGTTSSLGLGFKAFPFAHAAPGRMAVRVYHTRATTAGTWDLPRLWRGEHPMPGSHDWLLTACRMDFDRPVPYEIGGDLVGPRSSIELRLADVGVQLVDWSSLRRQSPGLRPRAWMS